MNKKFESLFKLEAEGYMLTQHSNNIYNVRRAASGTIIGTIEITLKFVLTNDRKNLSYIPYDVDIDIVDSTETLPIELFKKIIMAVAIIS